MRQRLGELLPAFSHWFGLHPWDVERLTFAEVRTYVAWLENTTKTK